MYLNLIVRKVSVCKYAKSIKCILLRHHFHDANSQYVQDMHKAWLKNPANVHVSWDSYFRQNQAPSPVQSGPAQGVVNDHLAVQAVIRSYQARGHCVAKVDPLGISFGGSESPSPPSIVLASYQMLEKDMNKTYTLPKNSYIGGPEKRLPLDEIRKRLEYAYCRHIGVEFMYLDSLEERNFVRERMESPGVLNLPKEIRHRALKRLTRAAEFEAFLMKKWSSEKRFGIEGCEVLIPLLKQIIDKSSELGVEHFVMCMAHRGRLNVLVNVCRKPLYQLFTQFVGLEPADEGSGDVKYHLGSYTERLNRATNKNVKLTVVANPSHLEGQASVALGLAKAEQFYKGDHEGKRIMVITMHGDAAFSGQGVNYETLAMSRLPCYTTHGRISIIINNQIGFTTDPRFSRSSRYPSDLGRVVDAPIFHVNADDPDSVVHVANVAAEWRARFHKDVVIDLVGYRKHGHNEVDEPMFTQPLMYTKIKAHKPVLQKYSEQLISEKVVTQEQIKEYQKKYLKICQDEFDKAGKETKILYKDWLDTPWPGFFEGGDSLKVKPTGVSESVLSHIGKKFSSVPQDNLDFVVHKGIQRILSARAEMIKNRKIDWSLGEAMCWGSLLREGIHVRLSGQDSERGTFSHRHHVLHHQTIDKVTYNALTQLYPDQAQYVVCNSPLCEYGVLGFETGYAQYNPRSLVMWEAQFGDFSNVAQSIFDQFLAAGQAKWVRQNGIVVLLPHGFEGMGPEHSSARPERFLQMCDDDPQMIPEMGPQFAIKQLHVCNWIVANCSTPGNYFHLLRRQVAVAFRKPLICFTPKSLLRHPECISSFDDLLEGTEFRRVISDDMTSKNPEQVKKVIFCTGKVYYDIKKARADAKLDEAIAVVRIEQLFPFPYDLIQAECERYTQAKLWWAQEEPKNQGGFQFVSERIRTLLKNSRELGYIGRESTAAPATGSKAHHLREVGLLNKGFIEL